MGQILCKMLSMNQSLPTAVHTLLRERVGCRAAGLIFKPETNCWETQEEGAVFLLERGLVLVNSSFLKRHFFQDWNVYNPQVYFATIRTHFNEKT